MTDMLPADAAALDTLREVVARSHVRGIVHLVAVSPPGDRQTFEVDVIGSVADARMLWSILCAAKQTMRERYSFTDQDAAQPVAAAS